MAPVGSLAKLCEISNRSLPLQCCRISADLARQVLLKINRAAGASCVIKIVHEPSKSCVYSVWLGEYCAWDRSIEVSPTLLQGTPFYFGDTVEVCAMVDIPMARDVALQPQSRFDWDVASTQGNHIENNLLRDVQVVAQDGLLTAQISPTLKASFAVTSITGHNGEAILEVARINNCTSLVIAPFERTKEQGRVPNSALFDDPELVAKLMDTSQVYPLRVMPEKFACSDTGLLSRHAPPYPGDLDPLQQLLDNSGPATPASTLGEAAASGSPWEGVPCDVREISTVWVHPLVAQSSLELALGRLVTMDELVAFTSQFPMHQWLCVISVRKQKERPVGLASSLKARVRLSEYTRPFCAIVPRQLRRNLSVGDGDQLTLSLLVRPRAEMPTGVRLRPVCWVDALVGEARGEPALVREPVCASAALAALVQVIELHRPFLLCHGQLLSLSLSRPRDPAGLPVAPLLQDFLVELHHSGGDGKLAPHVVLDFIDGTSLCQDVLAGLSLDNDHPLSVQASPLPTTTPSATMRGPAAALIGFETAQAFALLSMAPCMLPSALLATLSAVTCPLNSLLVRGAPRAGKSSLLRHLQHLLLAHPRLCVHVEFVDCNEWSSWPAERIISTLTSIAASLQEQAPSVLMLDGLDRVCTSVREEGLIKDEKALLVSVHLGRLLGSFTSAFREAHALGAQLLRTESQRAYTAESACVVALQRSVFVLASVTEPAALDASLVAHFPQVQALPCLGDATRDAAMRHLLALHQVPLHPTVPEAVLRALQLRTEGLVMGDLDSLARRVREAATRRVHRQIAGTAAAPSNVRDLLRSTDDDLRRGWEAWRVSSEDGAGAGAGASLIAGGGTSEGSWERVGGLAGLRAEVRSLLHSPLLFRRLYRDSPIRMPRAALLYGPPGCGKTFLARAIGSDFGPGFLYVKGPELLDKYIGASERRVRELFDKARALQRPACLCFDEFEALAPRRGRDSTGVTDRVVNQLLTYIDGAESDATSGEPSRVFILALTTRPDLVDAALLRPGRVEKHLYLGLPGPEDRKEILRVHLRGLQAPGHVIVDWVSVDEVLDEICCAERAGSMSSADWQGLVGTAYLLALQAVAPEPVSAGAAAVVTVTVTGEHMRTALRDTRPSLSEADLHFYEVAHRRFRGEPAPHLSAPNTHAQAHTQAPSQALARDQGRIRGRKHGHGHGPPRQQPQQSPRDGDQKQMYM